MQETENDFEQKPVRTLSLYVVLIAAVLIFLFSVLNTIVMDRHMPASTSTTHDRALRGKIISADKYTLSRSSKTYKATIFKRSLDVKKVQVFTKLFSIYSGIPEKKIVKIIKKSKGYTILAEDINANSAIKLKSLARKLRSLKVFKSVKNKNGVDILYGLDIIESGEDRYFPLKDTLSPVLGYVKNIDDGKYVEVKGVKGLEREFEDYLGSGKDGFVQGTRDVTGAIIRSRSSISNTRVDGYDVHLNIPLDLQRRIEIVLDEMKKSTHAKEIVAAVMESSSGKIIALASSERFNPAKIKQKDVYKLNPKFSEFLYEPGSVIKPITLALAMDLERVNPNSVFDTTDGKLKIGKKYTIRDDDVFDSQSATDIIVHSSNVGISKIAWLMSGTEFYSGLRSFGLGQRTGVDISRELPGKIKNAKLLSNKLHRANQSYGYGMHASFIQLLKAYNVFNNNGVMVTPRIVGYLVNSKGQKYRKKSTKKKLVPIQKRTANRVKNILRDVVIRGTAKAASYPGLDIGGKTGTAHIVQGGKYIDKYNSSFFGFANDDKGNKYTIGALAIELTKKDHHFASESAVPTFGKIVEALVETGKLEPNLSQAELDRQKIKSQRKQEALRKKRERTAQKLKRELKRERDKIIKQQKEERRLEKIHEKESTKKVKKTQRSSKKKRKAKDNPVNKRKVQKNIPKKKTIKTPPEELWNSSQEPPPVEGMF